MKPESLVIADQHAAVNTFSGLVHTLSLIHIYIELPGFKKAEIKMELEDGYLTIAAARTASNEERSEQGKLVRQERFSGSCTRTYFIGEEMNVEDIKARYENGELKVFVPKKDPQAMQTKKTISIE